MRELILCPDCGRTAFRCDCPTYDPRAAIDPVIDKVKGAKRPCDECHLQSGEVCDICGATS